MKEGDSKPPSQINDFLDKVQLPKLNVTEINESDNDLSEKELYIFLMSMQNNKSPGNDALIYIYFLRRYKRCFLIYVVQEYLKRNRHLPKAGCHKANSIER